MATNNRNEKSGGEFQWPFGTRNYLILAVALVVIILGYVTLGNGSMTLAPLLLVVGYCVLIPIALIVRDPKQAVSEEKTAETAAE